MMKSMATLYYIHDPMCSWCWAFAPVWKKIHKTLPKYIRVIYLLGGLAPDSKATMPIQLQYQIQDYWHSIEKKVPGTQFNYDFWEKCTPRRSTYPACRAVIAARQQNPDTEFKMIQSIQEAYYLQAQNPSLRTTLVNIAKKLALDTVQFSHDLDSDLTQQKLNDEISLSRELSNRGFPDLVLQTQHNYDIQNHPVPFDYLNEKSTLFFIQNTLEY